MAAPVILTTQSVLEGLQWRSFAFQPYATNSPTSWSNSPLPDGISINASTGKLSGTPSVPGVYNIALRATNGDGTSNPVIFCMGVEAAAPSQGTDIDLDFDVVTAAVTLSGGIPPQGASAADATAPVFRARTGDLLLLNVRLIKHGTTLAVTASEATVRMKADDGDVVIQESDSFVNEGTGENKRLRIYLPLTDELLKAAVGDRPQQDEAKTRVVRSALLALCDIDVIYANPDTATIGPANLQKTSDTFLVEVSRALKP